MPKESHHWRWELTKKEKMSNNTTLRTTTPRLPRSLNDLKESDLATRDILWRKMKGSLRWTSVVQLLARLGCSITPLNGSKKKVVDSHTGRCIVLHMPHPRDECRRDQLDCYRAYFEESLHIHYEDLLTPDEKEVPSPPPPEEVLP